MPSRAVREHGAKTVALSGAKSTARTPERVAAIRRVGLDAAFLGPARKLTCGFRALEGLKEL